MLNLSLEHIDSFVFGFVSVERLFTTDHHLCCLVNLTAVCTASIPWHSPCTDLLPAESMLILFIIVSVTITSSNILSVALHCLKSEFSISFRITIISLNTSDFLIAIYLTIIWVSSIVFQGEFSTYEHIWRSSILCIACGALVVVFKLCSMLFLFLLSLIKLKVVISPMTTKFKQETYVSKFLFVFAVLSVFFGFIHTTVQILTAKAQPTSLGLPFLDPSKMSLLVTTTTWFSALSEIIAALVCAVLHIVLVHELQTFDKNLEGNISKQKLSVGLVVQLILITSSNIVCWLPSNIFFITAMFLEQYPTKLSVWMTSCVLPFNSFFNLLVFVIFCLRSICCTSKSTKK